MSQMEQYHDLVKRILFEGTDILNERTGAICKTIIGGQLTFDLSQGFPALTTRKLPFKNIVGELLGFFRGVTSAKDFRELGCQFWNANANETQAWLENFYRKGEDDVGNIYGKQWTDWEVTRIAETTEEELHLSQNGWNYIGRADLCSDAGARLGIYRKFINQLEDAVRAIMTNPSDRRIIVSGWNIGEMDKMSLPPCHIQYMFCPNIKTRTMDVVMNQRSVDTLLGLPANIASTSLFLSVVCQLTGYRPGKVVNQMANIHLYDNSFEAVNVMLQNEHYPSPELVISSNVKQLQSLDEIKGCFERIKPEDFTLINYKAHESVPVRMVA